MPLRPSSSSTATQPRLALPGGKLATNIPGFNEGAVGDWKLVPDGVNGQGGGSHCAVLRFYDNTIVISLLFAPDEVRSTEFLRSANDEAVEPDALGAAKEYIELIASRFEHAAYREPYREALLALINEKAERVPVSPQPELAPVSVLPDLIAALRANVAQAQRKRSRKVVAKV